MPDLAHDHERVCQLSSDYTKLLDQFFDRYFEINPTAGTATGFHQYDSKLEDYSKAGIDQEIAFAKEFRDKFAKVDVTKLSLEDRDDLELVKSSIESTLLELEEIRSWQRNPDRYSSGITSSVFVIMSRNFAPQPERLKAVIARERQMPACQPEPGRRPARCRPKRPLPLASCSRASSSCPAACW